MRKHIFALLILLPLLITAGADHARAQGGHGTGVGVGVESMLAGPAGPTFVLQAANFHVSVLFSFDTGIDNRNLFVARERLGVAGRFFWELHSGELSDFSIGAGLGIEDNRREDDRADIHLEVAAQVRAFIVPNVALSASLGLAMEFPGRGDTEVAFLGQLTGGFGLTYFFF